MNQYYVTAEEVAKELQIARSTAYSLIRKWNKELNEMGYFTKSGSIPRAFFIKKCYGYESE